MPTLKKSAIATITAAALATGICAPAANAAGVKVNGGIRVLAHTEAEQKASDMPWDVLERVYAQDTIKLAFERIKQLKDLLPRAVSWYWVCVDVVLGGCALLVLAPASVRQGPGVG